MIKQIERKLERKSWKREDEEVVRHVCGTMIYGKSLFMKNILRTLAYKNAALNQTVAREGFERLYENVRNLRKDKRKR